MARELSLLHMPYLWQFPLITFPFSDGGSSPWGPFSEPLSLCYLKKPIVWADSSSSNLNLIMLGFYARIGMFLHHSWFWLNQGFSPCQMWQLYLVRSFPLCVLVLEKDLHEH